MEILKVQIRNYDVGVVHRPLSKSNIHSIIVRSNNRKKKKEFITGAKKKKLTSTGVHFEQYRKQRSKHEIPTRKKLKAQWNGK